MIEFYHQVKDISAVCRSFKTSSKTFYKWLIRYRKSGKQLTSLENQSKAPHKKRLVVLTFK